jgi:hypothetical protein
VAGTHSKTEKSYPYSKVTFSELEGIRRVGRPGIRWLDSVESDLRNLGIRWKEKSLERIEWKNIIKKAEV